MTIKSPEAERRKAEAAALADRYIGKDGSEPDLSRLDALGSLSPAEYGSRRADLAEEIKTGLKYLDKEYEERRKAAKVGSGRDYFLEDAEPWESAVNGAELLSAISAAAAKHVVLPAHAADAIALWCVFTHAHDCFDISPILAITSPTPECGKTTLLRLLAVVTARSLSASNISPSALFRTMDKWHPTLLVDEADTFARDNDELRGVLNCGHDRSGAFVIRNIGDAHEPGQFSTWGPKAIAMIGKLPATWQSRSIPITLKRMLPNDTVEPLRQGRTAHLNPLKRKSRRWTLDHAGELRAIDPELPETLYGRAADNWRPLVAIADIAGGAWPEKARATAEKLGGRFEDWAPVMALRDVHALFAARHVDRLPSTEITAALAEMENRPWPEWGRSEKPITPRQLAKLLDGFGIVPVSIKLASGKTPKGYHREAFEEAVERYVCLEPADFAAASATPPHPLEIKKVCDSLCDIAESEAADARGKKSQKLNGCGGVADRKAQNEDFHAYTSDVDPDEPWPEAEPLLVEPDPWPELPACLDRRKQGGPCLHCDGCGCHWCQPRERAP
jgi:putative DNA primase/helicase